MVFSEDRLPKGLSREAVEREPSCRPRRAECVLPVATVGGGAPPGESGNHSQREGAVPPSRPPIFLTTLPVNAPLALLAFKDWLLEMKLTQYDSEEGMASFLGKYNDPCRRPPRARAREGWSRLVQQ